MKRILLFIGTNIAIMVMLSVVVMLTGANRWLTAEGINYSQLLIFCAIFGFGGSFLSLLISKPVAKWTTGAKVVTGQEDANTAWLVSTVQELSARAGIQTPEVAIYEGEPNAFATGAFKNSALVAVSTGLVYKLNRAEVRAVLAHEVAHIANGDMQTMGLLQGVMNTFVMFAARIIGHFVDKVLLKNEEGKGVGFFVTVIVLEIVFGLLASIVVMAFSRHREYRADYSAASLMGTARPMQEALMALNGSENDLPKQVAAFGISGGNSSFMDLLRSHPPIEDRVQALNNWRP